MDATRRSFLQGIAAAGALAVVGAGKIDDVQAVSNTPQGILELRGPNGTTYNLWADDTGSLCIRSNSPDDTAAIQAAIDIAAAAGGGTVFVG